MPETSENPRVPLVTWFLGFGGVYLVGLVLVYVFDPGPPLLFYLQPMLALYGDNPATPSGFDIILDYLFFFGGSFVLYGLLGVLLGLVVRLAFNFRSSD